MEKMAVARAIFCLTMALGLGCAQDPPEDETAPPADRAIKPGAGGVLTIGSISFSVKDEVADFQPFIDYLAGRLRDHGIDRGQVLVAQTTDEMADLVQKGEVDLYVDSPFPILVVKRLAGVRPFLRRWKRGKGEYHSVIFVRKDSGIETLEDLKGKTVAFDDRSSTSGYLLPKAILIRSGLALNEYARFTDPVHPDSVGYVFSRDDENTIFWVLKKRVAAGTIDNANFVKMSGNRIGDLKILHRSVDVPRHVVAHRKDLDPALVERIREVLLAMHQEETGRKVLLEFQKTTQFDAFPQGVDAALEPIEALIRFIGEGLVK